jgi:signal transduction histidine kinase/ligand-binding sensor domain-containing protein
MRWLIVAALLAPAPAAAQTQFSLPEYVQTVWLHRDGIPLGGVADIEQTPDGYLWIATSEEGLLRFDGMRFVPIALPCGRPIGTIAAGRDGTLWFVCENRIMRRLASGDIDEPPHPAIRPRPRTQPTLFPDSRGRIWFTGTAVTYFHADGTPGPVAKGTEPDPQITVMRYAEDRDGVIWYSDGERLFRIRDDRGEHIADGPFFSLAKSSRGGILANQESRVVHVQDRSITTIAHLPEGVRGGNGALLAETDGGIWLGTRGHGVALIRDGAVMTSAAADAVAVGTATRVVVDREGSIWLGTSLGLQRFRRPLTRLVTRSEGVRGMPTFVLSDGPDLLVASPTLARISGKGSPPVPIGGEAYLSAGQDGDGRIWLGGKDLGYLDGNRFVPVTAADGTRLTAVFALRRGDDGALWALSQASGLYRIDGTTPRLIHAYSNLGSEFVISRRLGHWIGTEDAGIMRSADGLAAPTPVAGAPGKVHAMVDAGDTIWIGSGDGLARWRNGQWTTWTRAHGIPGAGSVFEILAEDHARFWLMTNGGLLAVPRDQLDATPDGEPGPLRFLRIGSLDRVAPHIGGTQYSPRAIRGPGGRLYFATRDSIAVVDPAQVTESALRPTIVIETVQADNQPVDLAASLRLIEPHRLQFDYTSLSLRSPENIRFRYRLEGHDRDWIEAGGQRRVTYDALPPGSYRFRVIGSGSEGVWNLDGATVAFQVAPVFWRTWWFRLVAVLAAVTLVVGGYRWRLRQISRELNLRFEERLAERTRIAQDLHDTLLQGMMAASMHVQVANDRVDDHHAAKPTLQRVLQLLTQVIDDGRAAVQGLRTQSASNDLVQAFTERARELASLDAVDFRISVEGASRPLRLAIREELTNVVCEAILNAVKHAAAERIEIVIDYSPTAFQCVVRDNGKGMDATTARAGVRGHFGLTGMRERARRIGATLSITSQLAIGTSVTVSVPARIAY